MNPKKTAASPSRVSKIRKSVADAFATYASDLRSVAVDLAVPYRHFIHWNRSKIVIFVYAFLAGTVFSIPFLLAAGGIVYYALSFPAGETTAALVNARETISSTVVSAALIENWGKVAVVGVLLVVIIAVFSIFVTYGYYLLANVYRSYLEGKELRVLSNGFFDWTRLRKFTAALGWSSLYSSIPLLIGAILFLAAVMVFGVGTQGDSGNLALGATTAVIGIVSLSAAIYWSFRTGFATFELLADEAGTETGKTYVRKSMELSKGKVARVILTFLPFAMVVWIWENVFINADRGWAVSRMYDAAVQIQSWTGKASNDVELMKDLVDPTLGNDDLSDLATLFEGETGKTDGVDRDLFDTVVPYLDRSVLDPNWQSYESLFDFASFLLLDGLLTMAFFSTYLRIGGTLRRKEDSETETSVSDGSK